MFCLFWSAPAVSQSAQKDSLRTDRSNLEQREFSEGWEKEYTGDEFDYTTEVSTGENLLVRALAVFFGWLESIFGLSIDPNLLKVIEIIIYFLLGILVLYLLIRFISGESFGRLFKKEAKAQESVIWEDAHIEEIDFHSLIRTCLEAGDYRGAIRYQFLQALKNLSENNLIEWHFEKTNLDYYREIKSDTLREHFEKAVRIYEYVWYGKLEINEMRYQQFLKFFESVNQKNAA